MLHEPLSLFSAFESPVIVKGSFPGLQLFLFADNLSRWPSCVYVNSDMICPKVNDTCIQCTVAPVHLSKIT